MMANKQSLSNMVFDVKEKLTDEEYKNIMDGIKKIDEKKYVKIRYMIFDIKMRRDPGGDETYPELIQHEHNTICQVIADDPNSLHCNIHYQCVVEERSLELWNRLKDEKDRWPMKYKSDMGQTYILICDFEEL